MSEKSTTGQGCDISGDVQRATAIFFEHCDFIRAVIRYKIKDESMAEDLFHEFLPFACIKTCPGRSTRH